MCNLISPDYKMYSNFVKREINAHKVRQSVSIMHYPIHRMNTLVCIVNINYRNDLTFLHSKLNLSMSKIKTTLTESIKFTSLHSFLVRIILLFNKTSGAFIPSSQFWSESFKIKSYNKVIKMRIFVKVIDLRN